MNKKLCKICGQEIISGILYEGDYDQINISVIWPGNNLDLDGHKTCLENINKLVVIPNREKVELIIQKEYDKN